MRKFRCTIVVGLAVIALLAGADRASGAISTHDSAFGAGYLSTPAGGVSKASATFKVPDLACPNAPVFMPLYLGVFGINGGQQLTMEAFVFAACNNGSEAYYAAVS